MRKFLMLLAALMVFVACQKEERFQPDVKREVTRSKYLSYDEAVKIATEATSMLESPDQSRSTITRRVKQSGVTCRVKAPTRSGESADSLYYVVNYEDDAGFALVAARRDAPTQLLAVTEAGSYSAGATTENEGFNMYVAAMESSLEVAGAEPTFKRDTLTVKNSWYEDEEIIGPWHGITPLVDVRWGQGSVRKWNNTYNPQYPYNKYCYNGADSVCYAGCVIVALAQIMSVHKSPSFYILNFNNQGQYKTINWDEMVTWTGGPFYEWDVDDANEIALWFRQLGDNASAQYTTDGTSSTIGNARGCLSSYGYSSNSPSDYDYEKICNSLDAGRPVYIRGEREVIDEIDGTIDYTGHAWVADGYLTRTCTYRTYEVFPLLTIIGEEPNVRRVLVWEVTSEYFYVHYNWGYDGNCNGYFSDGCFDLTRVKTEAGGYDYNDVTNNLDRDYQYDVRIVTGIHPNN